VAAAAQGSVFIRVIHDTLNMLHKLLRAFDFGKLCSLYDMLLIRMSIGNLLG